MKLTNVLFAFVLVLFAVACGEGDDEYGTPIDIKMCNGEIMLGSDRANEQILDIGDIPMEIRNYVASELAGFGLVSGSTYQNKANETFYLIQLNNSGQLLFDQSNLFVCAEGDFQTGEDDEYLSFDELPEAIQNYLNENHPGVEIDEAEFEDNEYKVELKNGIELCFDQLGNFIGNC